MARFGTNLDLFLKLKSGGDLKQHTFLFSCVMSCIASEISQEDREKILEFIRIFCVNVAKKWKDSGRSMKTFMNNKTNQKWLETSINWPNCDSIDLNTIMGYSQEAVSVQSTPTQETSDSPQGSHVEVGTSTEKLHRKSFHELGKKQKRRRTISITDELSEEELQHAFILKLKGSGKIILAKVIEHLCNNLETVPDIGARLFGHEAQIQKVSEDKTLALCSSIALSKWKYFTLRQFLNEENCAVLPSYLKLGSAKKRCYPSEESMEVTETGACIKLQALLDHTVQRILLSCNLTGESGETEGLKLIWKWGIDGSASQSNYKQKSSTQEFDDSSIVMTSIVPLRLINASQTVIWENPAPGSTDYCRPVKFSFPSETAQVIKLEESRMATEISELVPSHCGNFVISHELHMTMIDGKVASTVADVSSSATCPICLAKPSEMNNLATCASRPLRTDLYKHGLSSLHMKIRCMECLLHISYNMDFEKWGARGANKALKEARKRATQQEFREETGMLIDIVKQGFGTTNDGNTARRFFQDYQRTSRITGIDENLIYRFSVVLQAISSGYNIDIEKFRTYCKETAEKYVELYSWYHMPVSVHKLLMHGAEICRHFSNLPIGILSEEASEARNKDFRHVRSRHTRKVGRIETNIDILHGLLISSDPFISKIKPKFFKKSRDELLPEAIELLQIPSPLEISEEEETVMVEYENAEDPLALLE